MKDNTTLLQTAIERITLLQEQYKSLRDSSLLSDNFEYFEYKRSGVQSSLKILENLLSEQTPELPGPVTQPTINGVDDNGYPHGSWEYYYSNGQLCSKGNYVNGKEHGSWEDYWPNGQLCYKGYYDMGKRVSYNPDEPKVMELTLSEIAAQLNIPVEQLRIKK
jgi:hypothetical protein